jgi:hypothetical protein
MVSKESYYDWERVFGKLVWYTTNRRREDWGKEIGRGGVGVW